MSLKGCFMPDHMAATTRIISKIAISADASV